MNLKVVWKYAVVECGAQSVMIFGAVLMPMLYVDSLAISIRVSYQIEIDLDYKCPHDTMDVNIQVPLQEPKHFLAREVATYC